MRATAAIGNQLDELAAAAAAVPDAGSTITLPELTAGADVGPLEVTCGGAGVFAAEFAMS